MPRGMCEPVCVHCSTFEYTLYVSGGSIKSQRPKATKPILKKEKKRVMSVFWDHLIMQIELGSTPVDGSISHRSVRSTLRARMMAEDLCKLASCVSGIQMALNLCLLCSPAQRMRKE